VPAQGSLYQQVLQRIKMVTAENRVRRTTIKRLAMLVTGIVAARATTLARIADELLSLGVTEATEAGSVVRTLERVLSDDKLDWGVLYEPALKASIDWNQLLRGSRRLVLAVDESTKNERVHLLRVGLPYWGHCLPLAWELWPQNQPLKSNGGYWTRIEAVVDRVKKVIPAGLLVVALADRAYDVSGFVDRVVSRGWHWAVRFKAKGSGCFRNRKGREYAVKALISQRVSAPGMRWKTRGWVFKDAGWRQASIVAYWQPGEDEPLVVISDLPPGWELLGLYGMRYWIEPGFRSDKKLGWHWEDSQVRSLVHQERLLLGMAWASLIALCIGLEEAKNRLAGLDKRRVRVRNGQNVVGKPRHPDQSVFTMGLRRTRDWLYQNTDRGVRWLLTELDAPSWGDTWRQHLSQRYLVHSLQTVLA